MSIFYTFKNLYYSILLNFFRDTLKNTSILKIETYDHEGCKKYIFIFLAPICYINYMHSFYSLK